MNKYKSKFVLFFLSGLTLAKENQFKKICVTTVFFICVTFGFSQSAVDKPVEL